MKAASRLPRILVVRRAADFAELRRVRNKRLLRFLFRVPGLSPDVSRDWEARLNANLKECGCSLGAKCTLAGIAASVVWQSFYSFWSIAHWPGFLLRTSFVIVAAGGIGKLLGLALAERGIRNLERQIRHFEEEARAGD